MNSSFFNIPVIIDFELGNYLLSLIGFLLVVISIKLVVAKNLVEAIIAMSVFSLLIGVSYLLMDGPDVAMTEIALGACLSTCVYLSLLKNLPNAVKTNINKIKITSAKIIPAAIMCLGFIITLIYIGLELPQYGDVSAPLHTHLSKYYIENTSKEIGIDSFVAALLGSYRGFDTLGETSVILIAGISVVLLLSRKNSDA